MRIPLVPRVAGLILLGCATGRSVAQDEPCERRSTVTVHVNNTSSADVQITFGSYRPARAALGLSRSTYSVTRANLRNSIQLRIARGGLQIGTPPPVPTEDVICNDATLIIGPDLRSSFFYGSLVAAPSRKPAECCTVTFEVLVPEGSGIVYLAGSLPELGPWRPDGLVMGGRGRERTTRVKAAPGTAFEYKFTLGEWAREAVTSAGTVPPNHQLVLDRDTVVVHDIPAFKKDPREYIADWKGSGVEGRLVYWTDLASAHLARTRHVEIWLPQGYDDAPATRYPVLYMHDGQNLFDPRIANTGVDWGVDEAVTRLAARGVIPPVIVVGVWSTADRGPEYSPWHGAPEYARFLIDELMPRVNAEFRTLTGPAHTAVMGSSMGGLLSFYLVTHYPEAFGACGCVSTHFPFSESVVAQYFPGMARAERPDTTPYVVRDIAAGLTPPKGARYWFDYGTTGLDSAYAPSHQAVRAWLLGQGLVENRDFVIRAYQGATHNEASWRARLEDPLTFLFGGR
jgi:predicted alpha/beta superfamily hydrolase